MGWKHNQRATRNQFRTTFKKRRRRSPSLSTVLFKDIDRMPARFLSVAVVVVPVALGVPTVLAFVPPLVALPPATLPRLVQFQTLVIRFPAIASMSLDG
jgi:hypothetical protein